MTSADPLFEEWTRTLREAAARRELGWLVLTIGESERASFAAGQSPADYLDSLEAMAEWRGCGCGGA